MDAFSWPSVGWASGSSTWDVHTTWDNFPLQLLPWDPPELLNFLMCNWSLPQNTVHLLVETLLSIFWSCQEIDCPGTHWGRNQDKTGPRKSNPLQTVISFLTSCICNITFWPRKGWPLFTAGCTGSVFSGRSSCWTPVQQETLQAKILFPMLWGAQGAVQRTEPFSLTALGKGPHSPANPGKAGLLDQPCKWKPGLSKAAFKFPYLGGFPSTCQVCAPDSQHLGLLTGSNKNSTALCSRLASTCLPYIYFVRQSRDIFNSRVEKKPCIRHKCVRCCFPKATGKCFYHSKLPIHENYLESLRSQGPQNDSLPGVLGEGILWGEYYHSCQINFPHSLTASCTWEVFFGVPAPLAEIQGWIIIPLS